MKIKAILVMMFVVAGFVVPGWAEFRTVGVYDPTGDDNDADQSCVYTSNAGFDDPNVARDCVIDLAYMQANIGIAFDPNNMGGVVDVEGSPRSFERNDDGLWQDIIRARYGVGQDKTLDMIDIASGNIGLRGPGPSSDQETPISGDYAFGMGASMGYDLVMGNITGGVEGEKVIVFGGTILEEVDDAADVWATAYFSDGSSVTSHASCGDSTPIDQDTFFGFVAPAGEYITRIRCATPGAWLNLDDLGFITSANFPPASNAGPDQTMVQLYDASGLNASPGVTLAGSVDLGIVEDYTYSWSGGFATIDYNNNTTTAATPIVTFTAIGNYTLTLNVTGSVSGPLYSDTVRIEVVDSDSNAGPNQTVQLYIADDTGVVLAGSVNDPYGGETYTYDWTGPFTGGTTTGATPTVLFTTTGDHIVTLVATGTTAPVQGELPPDTVRIRVVVPGLDAGDLVQVEKTIAAYPGVFLDSTLSNPINTENYTYAWTSVPNDGVFEPNAFVADPVVAFPSVVEEYTLTLNVTCDGPTANMVDTVTVNVEADHRMIAYFAIDSGERGAGHYEGTPFEDGDPNYFITDTVGSSEQHDGVVDCSDGSAIQNSNNAPLQVHLNHDANDFISNEPHPHLDNVDTSITVACWIMNDSGRKVWAIEKVGTFVFGIDDGGDLRTQLLFAVGDPNLIKSKDGSGLGDDLHDDDLKINADGDSGGHEHVWHHIAFAYDSFTGYVEQFLDGALIYEKYVGSGRLLAAGPSTLAIGRNLTPFGEDPPDDGLRGAMDDIRIYNYPLEYHEIAGLASMGQAATLVSAGDDVTVDPNQLPYELQGRFIRLGQGVAEVSPTSEDGEYYVMWEQRSGPVIQLPDPNAYQAIFADPGDPESDVTFPVPGVYTLRLVSFEQLCQSGSDDNEIRSEMVITVLDASDCAGYLAFGGANIADVIGNDCIVDDLDFAEMAMDWMETWP